MNILSGSFCAGDRNAKINRHSPTHAELIPVVLIEGYVQGPGEGEIDFTWGEGYLK